MTSPTSIPFPLRQQYKADPSLIPLLPAPTWAAWLDDEMRQDTDNSTLAALFAVALDQAPTFDLHLAHAQHLLRSVSQYLDVLAEDPEAATEAPELQPIPEWPQGCIDAVTASVSMHGAHFVRGSELWDILLQLHQRAQSDTDTLRDLYLQRLSIPCQDLDSIMHAYQRFEASLLSSLPAAGPLDTDDNDNDAATGPTGPTPAEIYESRLSAATALHRTSAALAAQYAADYEPGFSTSPPSLPLLQAYLHSLSATLPSPLAVQGFLERIVAAAPDLPAAWLLYVPWAKANLATHAERINQRALAACPTSGALWVHKVRLATSLLDVVAQVLGATDAQVAASDMEAVVAEAASWVVRVGGTHADALELVASYLSSEDLGGSTTYVLEPLRVRFGLQTGNRGEVDAALAHLRTCTQARPWIRVLRMLVDARCDDVIAWWQAAAAVVVDDPRALAVERVEWAQVHAPAAEVELARAQLDALDAWYAQAAAAAATMDVQATEEPAPDMQVDPPARATKRSRPDAGTRTDERHTSRAHDKKRAKPDPELQARQAANDLARRNRSIVLKHVLPSYDAALRGVLEPVAGAPLVALRFLPTPVEGDKTQAFAELASHEALLEVFRYRRQLTLPGGAPLVFEMAKGATVDPEAELAALAEAKRAEIAKEKERLHAEQQQLDASGANVYVANLGKAVAPEELERHFNATVAEAMEDDDAAAAPAVKEVRIMVTKFGESKGFGYVLMASPAAARAVVDRWDGQVLPGHEAEGRALKVAISDPNKSKNKQLDPSASSANAPAHVVRGSRVRDYDPCTVMVRNLNFSTSEPTIRTLLEAHGSLTSMRLPRDAKGRPRGLAFATFATADQALSAVHALDGLTCDARQLAVSIPEPTAAAADSPRARQLAADQRAKREAAVVAEVKGKLAAAVRRDMQPAMRDAERAARRVVVHGVPPGVQVDWEDIVFGGLPNRSEGDADGAPEHRVAKEHVRDDGSRVLMFKAQADASRAVLKLDKAELPLGVGGEMVQLRVVESKPYVAPTVGLPSRGRGGAQRGRGGLSPGQARGGRGGRGGRLALNGASSSSSVSAGNDMAMDVDPSE